MRVLIISHAYVEEDNHKKLEILASMPGVELAVIYPERWRTWHGEQKNSFGPRSSLRQLTPRSSGRGQNSIRSANWRMAGKTQNYEEWTLPVFWGGDGGKYFYNPIQLIISILRFRPDVVHLEEEPFSLVANQVSHLCFLFRIKMTFFSWENIDMSLGPWRWLVERATFWITVGAVAGSQKAKERLQARGFKKIIGVFPQFGVDLPTFKGGTLDRKASSVITLGFVGRLAVAKGLDILLKALGRLGTPFRLLVVTSSPSVPKEILSLIGDLKLGEQVELMTAVPHHQLLDFYRQMDIFVLPSRTTPTWREQFGRTLIEAMACGVPVVGSSSGAIPEVIGEAGLIFQEDNLADLVEKVRILEDPAARDRFIALGLKRVGELFTAQKIGDKLYHFLKDL